jgi:hypothetical protein
LTEGAVLQTWAYSDIKKAYQRYEQLTKDFDVDKETNALSCLYYQFKQCHDFDEQVDKCEAAFDALEEDKPKRGRARSSATKVIITGTQDDHVAVNENGIEAAVEAPALSLRQRKQKISKLSLSATRKAKKKVLMADANAVHGATAGDKCDDNTTLTSGNKVQDDTTPQLETDANTVHGDTAGEKCDDNTTLTSGDKVQDYTTPQQETNAEAAKEKTVDENGDDDNTETPGDNLKTVMLPNGTTTDAERAVCRKCRPDSR